MSIIYEALKKTEKIIHTDLKIGTDTKPGKLKSKIKIIALYVIMICLGLFIGNLVTGFLNHPAKTKVVKNTPPPAPPLPVAITTPEKPKQTPPAIKTLPLKTFVLNGIFFSRDEGYALINNQIVKIDDTVGGAQVYRITEDEVELNSSGTTIKLNRPR